MVNHIIKTIRILLLATALTPLVYSWNFIFPYITLKTLFVRGAIQIAIALTFFLFSYLIFKNRDALHAIFKGFLERFKKIPKSIVIFSTLFIGSQVISTVFAESPYRSFWGTIERGEGLFNLLHFVVFFCLIYLFWEKEHFERYFKISVVVGSIVYLYAFIQAAGVTQFPFAFPVESRAGSFMGNAAFLAAYSLFVIINCFYILYFEKQKNNRGRFWLSFSLIVLILSPVVILLTKTRGALLGLFAAVVFSTVSFAFRRKEMFYRRLPIRKFMRIILILCVTFAIAFFFSRESTLWQKIPGFDRLAQTSSITSDASSQTRLLGWKLGLEAVVERPFIGWGIDHYLAVFQKLYYPAFANYGETWLDKAHNKFIDVGVEQGLFGFVAYIGFIFSFILFLCRRNTNVFLGIMTATLFLGYLIQNIFLFDEINIYASFFVLIAFSVGGFLSTTSGAVTGLNTHPAPKKENFTHKFFLGISGVAASIFCVYVLIFTTFIPMTQAYYARQAETPKSKKEFLFLFEKATHPYNFIQYSVRPYLLDAHYRGPVVFINTELKDVARQLIDTVHEVYTRDPLDIRLLIREAQSYNQLGKADQALYKKGEEAIQKAIIIAPNRQDLYYTLAISFAGQGRHEEAIATAEKSVALNPGVARSWYYLALVSIAGDKKEKASRAMENMRRIDPALSRWSEWDFQGILLIYEQLNDTDRVIDLVTGSVRGVYATTFPPDYYEKALAYYAFKRDADNFIAVAKYIKGRFPERANDMEVLTDLAKNGNWTILYSL